jgi:NAD(P)-dependent dehydrogenase (short-subunit alcohol dehydrogenase family)
MEHALITGVAGFIGSHLAEELLRQGWLVTGVDTRSPASDPVAAENLAELTGYSRFQFVQADVSGSDLVMLLEGAQVVFHLAALPGVRSQDLWLGFCYDIFTATILQELLAGWLGAQPGSYLLSVDSLHLYAHDLPKAQRLPAAAAPGVPMAPLITPWESLDDLLASVISGTAPARSGWADLARVLASYRTRKAGDHHTARATVASSPSPLAAALCRWYDRLDRDRQSAREALR